MYRRVKLYYKFRTDSSCWIGTTFLSEYLNDNYIISNNPSDLNIYGPKKEFYFYYYFSNRGLELNNNHLAIESVVCAGPKTDITIPWSDLLPYCINSKDNIILQKCEKFGVYKAWSEWLVESPYLNLLETPNESGTDTLEKTEPFVLKGEKVMAISACDDFLKISYVSVNGKVITGWVPITSLERLELKTH